MSGVRITAGTLRGRKVPVPRDDVRPTSERARQAFFDICRDAIPGGTFLDLFAGSGIFSFEALSRGAAAAVAVDASRRNALSIERVAGELGLAVRTVAADALAGIKHLAGEVFHVTYADPPYAWPHHLELLMAIDRELAIPSGGIVAIEHRRRSEPFAALEGNALTKLRPWRRAEYGEVWIDFFIAEVA